MVTDGRKTGVEVEVGVLGRVRATVDGREVDLGGPRQRALVAALAVAPGRTVPTGALIEAVWDGAPPEAADRTFRSYVSRLRRALTQAGVDGAAVVRTDTAGYRLDDRLAMVDATLFAGELEEARALLAMGEAGRAVALIGAALGRWEGQALGAFADRPWAAPSAVRLEELRLAAEEVQVRAMLDAGRISDAVALAEQLASMQPLRESVVRLHALALYRAGRDADALRVTREFRDRLADEHGLDPSQQLEDLEAMVLDRDPRLDRPVGGERLRGYVLHEPIARSPLGTVHRGEQPSVGREVAITVLPPERADDADVVRAFEARVQAVAGLAHPHILPVYDYWREPGGAYVVTRFPSGGTLEQRLRRGRLSADEALQLGEQLAAALGVAHERGVVHGRIGPDAVVVDDRGDAFLWAFPLVPADAHPSVDVAACAALVRTALTPADGAVLTDVLPPAAAAALGRAREDGGGLTAAALATALATARTNGDAAAPPLVVEAGPNPYRGLAAFRETDADVFFGREALTEQLLGAVARRRAVAVVGPSGSGKSSVVRAGLLSQLRADGAYVTTMVPGTRPLAELEIALTRVAAVELDGAAEEVAATADGLSRVVRRSLPTADSELVLVIDQFEELFTVADATERDRFLVALRHVAEDHGSPVRVVLTLRADFLGAVLAHPQGSPLVRERSVMVGPPTDEELHAIVTRPAETAGVAVEPALATAVVADAVRSPGSLPMVQFALTEVYSSSVDDGVMTLESYRRIGGIEGVLGQRAEEVFAALDETGQRAGHLLFMRLVVPNDDGPATRRRALRSELAHVPDEVLDAFGRARLLRFDHEERSREPTVEVSHEALFRAWPRLVAWIEEGIDDLRLLGHLTVAAQDWDDAGRVPAELYRGDRLDAALDFASGHDGELADVEQKFLEASRQERLRQQEADTRTVRRLRLLTSGLAVGLVLALVAGGVAIVAQRNADALRADEVLARQAAEDARAEEALVRAEAQADALAFAAIAALEQDDIERGALLAAEAYAASPDIESQGALLEVLGVDPRSVSVFPTPAGLCSAASGDASRVAFPTITEEGPVIQVRNLAGAIVDELPWREPNARCVTLSPTTDHLVQIMNGGLQVDDLSTGAVLAVRDDLHFLDSSQNFELHPTAPEVLLLRDDGTVEFASVPDLEPVAVGEVGLALGAGDPDAPTVVPAAVGYSEDGSLAFAAEAGTLYVFDATDGGLVGTYDVEALSEAQGGYLYPFVSAGAGLAGFLTERELVVTTIGGQPTTRRVGLGARATPYERGVAVEPGGRRAAVVTEEGVVVVDLELGATVGGPLPSDTTSLDIRWVGTGDLLGLGPNGVARFDVDRQLTYGSLIHGESFAPGLLLPASDGSGTVVDGEELLFVGTTRGRSLVIEDRSVPAAARALAGGRWISARRDTGLVRIGDVGGVLVERQLPVAYDVPAYIAIEPVGDRVGLMIASIEGDAAGWVLDGVTGEVLASFDSDDTDPLRNVVPLGQDLTIVRSASNTVTVHDDDGRVVDEPRVVGVSNGVVAGSPSGRMYVVSDYTGTLNLVDRETGDVTELVGAFSQPASVDFLDDHQLVSHHGDGATYLWDIGEGRRVGQLWSIPVSLPAEAAVDRSAGELVQPVQGGLARFPLDPDEWLDAVCERVSRGLTPAELDAVVTGFEATDPCGRGDAS